MTIADEGLRRSSGSARLSRPASGGLDREHFPFTGSGALVADIGSGLHLAGCFATSWPTGTASRPPPTPTSRRSKATGSYWTFLIRRAASSCWSAPRATGFPIINCTAPCVLWPSNILPPACFASRLRQEPDGKNCGSKSGKWRSKKRRVKCLQPLPRIRFSSGS